MRILVLAKPVPDPAAGAERLGPDFRLDRAASPTVVNGNDEYALEAALQLVEAAGEGEVIALTVGGPDAVAAVRKALQLGVGRAIHVSDPAIAGSDVFGTARVLAAAIRKVHEDTPLDLVITGMAALDGLTSMLPTALAVELDWAQLTLASALTVSDGVATIERHLPDAHETVSAPLRAVVSVTDEANKPRYPNFKMIMAARTAVIPQWSLEDLGVVPSTVGSAAARVSVIEAAPREPRTPVIVTDTGEGGRQLADFLLERGLA